MAQLEPLPHDPEEGDTCPACMLTTEIYNEMAGTLERASLRLPTDDIAFIIALLMQSVMDAAPTNDAREFFVNALGKHLFGLMDNPPYPPPFFIPKGTKQ